MALHRCALIDKTYFNHMWTGDTVDNDYLENLINGISASIELFCNRPLTEVSYTFEESEHDEANNVYYIPELTIFDAPPKATFWFPTYPISTLTYFEISGIQISAADADDYSADTGYVLYKRRGKLIYADGYDYPYLQNVQVKWKGGYPADSAEMSHLKYLCFLAMKDSLNAPQNMTYEMEKIGNYSYKTASPYTLTKLQGLSPKVFADLSKYRREAIG